MTDFPHVDGCVLVTRGDDVVYRANTGPADSRGRECVPGTRFQLASVSKQFAAAAILALSGAGRFDLSDRVGDLVPGCPDSWRDVTVHRLLTHTSGLGHWEDYPEIDLFAPMERAAVLAAFQARPPVGPVDRYYYSSPGYGLLAAIVEQTGGLSYQDFVTHSFFEPAGMYDTFVGNPKVRTDLATGFGTDGEPVPSFELDTVGMAAGDVWSTVDDMWRWNRAIHSGLILSRGERELAFTGHAAVDDTPDNRYGYGWAVNRRHGAVVYEHTGSNAGFKTYAGWFPEPEAAVIVLSNNDSTLSVKGGLDRMLDAAWTYITT